MQATPPNIQSNVSTLYALCMSFMSEDIKKVFVLLEQVGVEGEEAVQRVGVGGHAVSPSRAADHRQHVAVVPLYDGVAEHHLILPATKTHQLLWMSREGHVQLYFISP